jgi:hypothetical protein
MGEGRLIVCGIDELVASLFKSPPPPPSLQKSTALYIVRVRELTTDTCFVCKMQRRMSVAAGVGERTTRTAKEGDEKL